MRNVTPELILDFGIFGEKTQFYQKNQQFEINSKISDFCIIIFAYILIFNFKFQANSKQNRYEILHYSTMFLFPLMADSYDIM